MVPLNTSMRSKITSILAWLPLALSANVSFVISDGLDNASVKTKIESDVSALLTEINAAQSQKRALQFRNLNVPKDVQASMAMLWETSPFSCTDEMIVERCLQTPTGYQVRNIPLEMRPLSDRNFSTESDYQEAVLNFKKNGEIESFYLSIANNLYTAVLKENKEITDFRRRQLILDYVEQFRTAYNTKDLAFLNQVFSDDALIITGKVVKQSKDNIQLPDKIVYSKKNKAQYIAALSRVFKTNSYIRVTFDEIKVMRHPANRDFYGVTLHQGYTASNYHDDGYLFLLWDFTDESAPKIHVRTWQPDQLNGAKLPEEERISLYDFDI